MPPMATIISQQARTQPERSLISGRRARILRENLTAYLFIFPAGLVIFLFGLFPVAFAFFVSLHRWRITEPEQSYLGLDNFTNALGSFGLVLFFWLGIGTLAVAGYYLWRAMQTMRAETRSGAALGIIPALFATAAGAMSLFWFFRLLPVVLDIPDRLRAIERTQGIPITSESFMREMSASFAVPSVLDWGNLALALLIAALLLIGVYLRLFKLHQGAKIIWQWVLVFGFVVSAGLILQLTLTEINLAVETARATGTELPIWSQIILISAGFGLVGMAYWLWTRGIHSFSNRRFWLAGLAAALLLIAGYVLVTQLPNALSSADSDLLNSFYLAVVFVIGTVPFQLAAGLGIAYLLFQKDIRGKTLLRMVYFLPYITPFAATSVVFRILFSHRETSPVNQLLTTFGIEPQRWLLESTPVGNLLFGVDFPTWLAGPSLALLVIMIYTTWTYIGYDAVVFLAGLGNIPTELYEAARIDGAAGWRIFRHITLPLLSPTTFFLSLIAITGAFQAFTQVFIMRSNPGDRSVRVMSVYIYDAVSSGRVDYGSAMAFVLFGVILILTLIQNRVAGRKVFYG